MTNHPPTTLHARRPTTANTTRRSLGPTAALARQAFQPASAVAQDCTQNNDQPIVFDVRVVQAAVARDAIARAHDPGSRSSWRNP